MPNTRRNPRLLRSLQYFEAVARHGSMLAASQEFGISPSAVSHQLRELSRSVGEELFVRNGNGIALTFAGEALSQHLSGVFQSLESVVRNVVGPERAILSVGVCSAFGPAWLAPRLSNFRAANPKIDLELRLYAQDPEQTQSVADCIVSARPVKLGYASTDIFDERLVAVASPDLAESPNGGRPPLITTDVDPGVDAEDWHSFARLSGQDLDALSEGGWVRCTHYILAMSLARAGQGIALVPDFLAEEALAEGKLRRYHPESLPSGRTYRLCVKEAKATEPAIRRLSVWLRRETAALRDG